MNESSHGKTDHDHIKTDKQSKYKHYTTKAKKPIKLSTNITPNNGLIHVSSACRGQSVNTIKPYFEQRMQLSILFFGCI